jgi:clan AA aspartic protease (TIGR02281 family)
VIELPAFPLARAFAGMTIAALLALAMPATAQSLPKCNVGEQVSDGEGNTGVIVASTGDVCQIRYADGQTRGWAFWSLRPAAQSPPPDEAAGSIVLHPPSAHSFVFRADQSGHFRLTATANGVPLHFLVDTGATLVYLTPKDARAAGFNLGELVYDGRAATGNGVVRVAPLVLREIRIGDMSVERVSAAVIENIQQSVLGMSFLERLKSFDIRGGALTINW